MSSPRPQPGKLFQPVEQLTVCVVLPAYNAAQTLEPTLRRLQPGSWNHLILVDDASSDDTVAVAESLRSAGFDMQILRHQVNRGYGGNQKSCYRRALETGDDIIVMLHPDNQYDAALLPYMTGFIAAGVVDVVLGSRILRRQDALGGGMPPVKYFANRLLTITENVILGFNLPEYHTGYRAYHRRVLERVAFERCSDDFVFDQQFLVQARVHGFRVGAVPVPTHYGPESSSISWEASMRYCFGTLAVLCRYLLYRAGWRSQPLFEPAAVFEPGDSQATVC